MAERLRLRCPSCRVYIERELKSTLPEGFTCGRCQTGVLIRGKPVVNHTLKHCVLCNYPYFYIEKDFPKFFRIFFMLLAIGLSFHTYGLSLIFFALIDLMLYHFIPWMRICYLCNTEYRGFSHDAKDSTLKPFDPHKGVAYDARRAQPKL